MSTPLARTLQPATGMSSIPADNTKTPAGADAEQGKGAAPDAGASIDHAGAAHRRPDPDAHIRCSHAGKRVLVVEDNWMSRQMTTILLKMVGLRVEEADSGVIGYDFASRNDYALITMDLMMPHLDGANTSRLIRLLPQHRFTPIIALTSNLEHERQHYLENGINDFLFKPIDTTSLYATVLHWLEYVPTQPETAP